MGDSSKEVFPHWLQQCWHSVALENRNVVSYFLSEQRTHSLKNSLLELNKRCAFWSLFVSLALIKWISHQGQIEKSYFGKNEEHILHWTEVFAEIKFYRSKHPLLGTPRMLGVHVSMNLCMIQYRSEVIVPTKFSIINSKAQKKGGLKWEICISWNVKKNKIILVYFAKSFQNRKVIGITSWDNLSNALIVFQSSLLVYF